MGKQKPKRWIPVHQKSIFPKAGMCLPGTSLTLPPRVNYLGQGFLVPLQLEQPVSTQRPHPADSYNPLAFLLFCWPLSAPKVTFGSLIPNKTSFCLTYKNEHREINKMMHKQNEDLNRDTKMNQVGNLVLKIE